MTLVRQELVRNSDIMEDQFKGVTSRSSNVGDDSNEQINVDITVIKKQHEDELQQIYELEATLNTGFKSLNSELSRSKTDAQRASAERKAMLESEKSLKAQILKLEEQLKGTVDEANEAKGKLVELISHNHLQEKEIEIMKTHVVNMENEMQSKELIQSKKEEKIVEDLENSVELMKKSEESVRGHTEALEKQFKGKEEEAKEAREEVVVLTSLNTLLEQEIATLKGCLDTANEKKSVEESAIIPGASAEDLVQLQKEKNDEIVASKEKMDELMQNSVSQEKKIEILNAKVSALTGELKKKTDEVDTVLERQGAMGLLLRDMDTITLQTLDQENQLLGLKKRSETLESRLKNKTVELEEMDRTLAESNTQHDRQIGVLTNHLKSLEEKLKGSSAEVEILTELGADFEKARQKFKKERGTLLNQSAYLEKMLERKTAQTNQYEEEIQELRGKLKVLIRNMDKMAQSNVSHAKKINALNESILSLSAAASAIFTPEDMMHRLQKEQSKALSLVLEDPKSVMKRIIECNKKMVYEASSLEQTIQSVKTTPVEGIIWEHYGLPIEQQSSASYDEISIDDQSRGYAAEMKNTIKGVDAKITTANEIMMQIEKREPSCTFSVTTDHTATYDKRSDHSVRSMGTGELTGIEISKQHFKPLLGSSTKGDGTRKDTLTSAPSDETWDVPLPKNGDWFPLKSFGSNGGVYASDE